MLILLIIITLYQRDTLQIIKNAFKVVTKVDKIELLKEKKNFLFFFLSLYYLSSPNLGLTPGTYNPNVRGSDGYRRSNRLWTKGASLNVWLAANR